jgi:hypothetical protein
VVQIAESYGDGNNDFNPLYIEQKKKLNTVANLTSVRVNIGV